MQFAIPLHHSWGFKPWWFWESPSDPVKWTQKGPGPRPQWSADRFATLHRCLKRWVLTWQQLWIGVDSIILFHMVTIIMINNHHHHHHHLMLLKTGINRVLLGLVGKLLQLLVCLELLLLRLIQHPLRPRSPSDASELCPTCEGSCTSAPDFTH